MFSTSLLSRVSARLFSQQAATTRVLPFKKALTVGAGMAAAAGALNWVSAEEETETIYVINGFYMAMREKYTKPGASIHYYLVEWDASKLSWEDFRGRVLGGTDPTSAEPGSLRKKVLEQWKTLGLSAEPNVGDNGVHASASPFEALAERINWVGVSVEEDGFGKAMLNAGIPKATIMDWTVDPQVPFEGKKSSLFDLLEDMDGTPCLQKAASIAGASGTVTPITKMQAFVFIKPHAVTPATKTLIKDGLQGAGISVVAEGDIDHKTIENKKLIDQHYYAIANKASLTKPKDLNPPAKKLEDFASKFGFTWEKALSDGIVYNAVDACKKLGVDGVEMDKLWAKSKKAGNLVKFGGGFYAGKVEAPKKKRGWFSFLTGR